MTTRKFTKLCNEQQVKLHSLRHWRHIATIKGRTPQHQPLAVPINQHYQTQRKIGRMVRKNAARQLLFLPGLNLAGRWMEIAGFQIGHSVTVTVSHGVILITGHGQCTNGIN